jgi:uncharacterized protein YbjT (DUF2867 family)
MAKIMIIGATGTVGKAVSELLAPDYDIVRVGHHRHNVSHRDGQGLQDGSHAMGVYPVPSPAFILQPSSPHLRAISLDAD